MCVYEYYPSADGRLAIAERSPDSRDTSGFVEAWDRLNESNKNTKGGKKG